jgi:hypothetical protein
MGKIGWRSDHLPIDDLPIVQCVQYRTVPMVSQSSINQFRANPISEPAKAKFSFQAPLANQFYIYINQELIPWDIYAPHPENCGFVRYFSQVLQTVDRQVSGLTFYVTMTEMHQLTTYGDRVVVLILGDEFYRIPQYRQQVRAVFKCYGTHQIRQQFMDCLSSQPAYLKFALLSQALKNLVYRLPLLLHDRVQKLGSAFSTASSPTPIYDIPLGYYNSQELPIVPIASRAHDVFFQGSISHDRYSIRSLKYWVKTPKAYSRETMVRNLQKIQAKHPEIKIKLSTNFKFAAIDPETEPHTYSQDMMQTKICCVPRGTTAESYRFFEAMRYGCIIITEVLPARWFYQGAPIVQLRNWDDLESVLHNLLADPALMESLHQQTLDWWTEKCSEAASGQYIAEQIRRMQFTDSLRRVVNRRT